MKEKPFLYIKSFGIKLYIVQILILILNKLGILTNIKKKLRLIKNRKINNILTKRYQNIIDEYKNYHKKKDIYSNKIWILWYTGIENAPEIVKLSIDSIKKHCPNFEITIITKDNIDKYYKIPDYIKKKVDNKTISLTHFSDILRMNLLKKYGGRWADATIYLTDNPYNKENFYTIKFHTDEKESISQGKWCGFFIGGKAQIFYDFMVSFFNEYWQKENLIIDYFLIDYIIKIAYNNISEIKKIFDNVPYNNEEIHTLESMLNSKFDNKLAKELLSKNCVHKLTYKKPINDLDKENYYNKLIKSRK